MKTEFRAKEKYLKVQYFPNNIFKMIQFITCTSIFLFSITNFNKVSFLTLQNTNYSLILAVLSFIWIVYSLNNTIVIVTTISNGKLSTYNSGIFGISLFGKTFENYVTNNHTIIFRRKVKRWTDTFSIILETTDKKTIKLTNDIKKYKEAQEIFETMRFLIGNDCRIIIE